MTSISKLKTWAILIALTLTFGIAVSSEAAPKAKTRVLLVVGGHPFDTNDFLQVFKDNTDITFQMVEHPKAHAHLTAEAARNWDVLVTYDYARSIAPEAQTNLLERLKEGKGLVALHHAIAAYQDWPEYAKIIGVRYYTKPATVNGVQKARSQFKHDVEVPVKIANKKHPVTKGVEDFVIHDETYKLYDVDPEVNLLLTTDCPASEPKIGWAKTYDKARVVFIQNGHDRKAYESPAFRRLLAQSIRWTAPKKQ